MCHYSIYTSLFIPNPLSLDLFLSQGSIPLLKSIDYFTDGQAAIIKISTVYSLTLKHANTIKGRSSIAGIRQF